MKLITERDRIHDAIKHFRTLWGNGTYGADGRGIAIGAELAKLDADTVPVEEVNELIGNDTWTQLTCDECGTETKSVVEVGEEPDDESATARLCFDCIDRAAAMRHSVCINGERSEPEVPENFG